MDVLACSGAGTNVALWLCRPRGLFAATGAIIIRTRHVVNAGTCLSRGRPAGLYRRRLPELRTGLLQCAGGPHARRQDLADAPDGRAGQAQQRPHPDARRRCHRRAGAPAQRVDGLSAVHQLPEPDGVREHRFAAAPGRRGQGRDRAQGAGNRADAAHRQVPQALSAGALRRPAAAYGHGPRAGQGCRPGAVRRAAGEPRLQAA